MFNTFIQASTRKILQHQTPLVAYRQHVKLPYVHSISILSYARRSLGTYTSTPTLSSSSFHPSITLHGGKHVTSIQCHPNRIIRRNFTSASPIKHDSPTPSSHSKINEPLEAKESNGVLSSLLNESKTTATAPSGKPPIADTVISAVESSHPTIPPPSPQRAPSTLADLAASSVVPQEVSAPRRTFLGIKLPHIPTPPFIQTWYGTFKTKSKIRKLTTLIFYGVSIRILLGTTRHLSGFVPHISIPTTLDQSTFIPLETVTIYSPAEFCTQEYFIQSLNAVKSNILSLRKASYMISQEQEVIDHLQSTSMVTKKVISILQTNLERKSHSQLDPNSADISPTHARITLLQDLLRLSELQEKSITSLIPETTKTSKRLFTLTADDVFARTEQWEAFMHFIFDIHDDDEDDDDDSLDEPDYFNDFVKGKQYGTSSPPLSGLPHASLPRRFILSLLHARFRQGNNTLARYLTLSDALQSHLKSVGQVAEKIDHVLVQLLSPETHILQYEIEHLNEHPDWTTEQFETRFYQAKAREVRRLIKQLTSATNPKYFNLSSM